MKHFQWIIRQQPFMTILRGWVANISFIFEILGHSIRKLSIVAKKVGIIELDVQDFTMGLKIMNGQR